MTKISKYKLFFLKIIICMACVGMVGLELNEIIFEDRELALVRRQIPDLTINNNETKEADVGTSLFNGDTLTTDQNGYAMILFMDQSVTRMRPESQLIIRGQVNRDQSSSTRLDISAGEIFLNINRDSNSEVEVGTDGTVASVKGTVFGARASGYYWVEEGEIEVLAVNSGETATITERMFAELGPDGSTLITGELTDEELNNLGNDYRILDSDLIEKTIRFRFRDENGQLREIELNYY